MILIYHKDNAITEVTTINGVPVMFNAGANLATVIKNLAAAYPATLLVWCLYSLKETLNIDSLPDLLHNNRMMLSYNTGSASYFDARIGYIEESVFIKVNKKVRYPTWQMSSDVGMVHASMINAIGSAIPAAAGFDYYLNSIAKAGMPQGLLCYSEPKLLHSHHTALERAVANTYTLFRFVKQHYRTRWVFLLLLNLFLYERKIALLPFLASLFFSNRTNRPTMLQQLPVQTFHHARPPSAIDVVIPTIGRSKYLYDFLRDLRVQTVLPYKIIIIEQNPEPGCVTDLPFLLAEDWPFKIEHVLLQQTGACNARNLALQYIESDWAFLADDDIRIPETLIADTIDRIITLNATALTLNCLQKDEQQVFNTVMQWGSFGSGCSFVATAALRGLRFDMRFEHGFGEDSDFGRQLRNKGTDVLYIPSPSILHLKAPVGGFRSKPVLPWHADTVLPKPSPTIMLYHLLHNTTAQLCGYKTTLFFKYYKLQRIKNPFKYISAMNQQWQKSHTWAMALKSVSGVHDLKAK